ncbi:asparagine synthase (glutamine-hydrolyzing) [Pedobacter rhizosphaerae]|uniref:asparagine synthase (glutamine-hydrolyzing) n=1 Tax=Pedobacter rhizosphaerae TaxID=390241 RepID=A0A1H9N7D6_9SPHI|nr:asparagine synthase (glutamine-hydrolyzing) [Pedobacter rhizosphaerae]SER31834.1 asparagine synthase (glutamine-hydrolysing) [Pedobacter rhizosphaerae]
MCRIAGIIDRNRTALEIQTDLSAMCNSMKHGGPDDEGFYIGEELGLGHRRLSIIDLSTAGHQPMFYGNQNLVISYNGEIFNYKELKTELLSLGLTFETATDTEVILAAYQAFGIQSFAKLQGMFAFALHDQMRKQTFLVRDCSGIKPLYYYAAYEKLVFASEVKAFKQTTYLFEENPNWKVCMLAFGHLPEPYTTLDEVNSLKKGYFLQWNHSDSTYQIKPYAVPSPKARVNNETQARENIKQSLTQAVKKHLISDAPIGAFLSGGIDSSLITLLAQQHLDEEAKQQKLNTLSIHFDVPSMSEKPYQDLIQAQAGTNHSEYLVTQKVFNTYLSDTLSAMDQPSTDGINSWFICHFAKQKGLKAVLSGIGADEIFGGYPSFKRMAWVKKLRKTPSFILKFGERFKKSALKRAYYLSYQNTVGDYLFLRGVFSPAEIAKILNLSLVAVDEVLRSLEIGHLPTNQAPALQASWLESNLYMQNQLLKDTDYMSMQHGVEVRVPFLDANLLEEIAAIQQQIKYQKDKPKRLLIDSFKDILPEKIWNRPKMGFTFPFQKWLIHNEYFWTAVNEIENPAVKQHLQHFKKGKLHWSKAMVIHQVFNGFKV